jgi:polysaccharide export outer membrane protein
VTDIATSARWRITKSVDTVRNANTRAYLGYASKPVPAVASALRLPRRVLSMVAAAGAMLVSACSLVPSDGPLISDVESEVQLQKEFGFRIVDATPQVVARMNARPAPLWTQRITRSRLSRLGIGPGDVLSITVYQASAGGLFTPQSQSGDGVPAGGLAMTSDHQMVDESGNISFPYVGLLRVQGDTPWQAQQKLQVLLRDKMVQPQVSIRVISSETNKVLITGAVNTPSRPAVTPARETILQLITQAGGPTKLPSDIIIQLHRGGVMSTARMQALTDQPSYDAEAIPGDRINLVADPQIYTVFGASGRVGEYPLDVSDLTLAQALARAGGSLDARADSRGVFLLRFEDAMIANAVTGQQLSSTAVVPIVYKANLDTIEGYFMTEGIHVANRDIIFIPNARTVQWQKFLDLLRVSISPATTGATLSR